MLPRQLSNWAHCRIGHLTIRLSPSGATMCWLSDARQGYKPAMYRLSEALRDGRGADVDEKEALYWLQLGADLGNCDCQCALGVCYLNGGIVEKDFDKAHQWFQIASLQGEGWPWYLLGISYEDGLGVTKDYEAAVRCFKEGAELGDPRSIFKVGMAYYYGNGLPESNPAAATWLKRAAELGNSDAQSQLGFECFHFMLSCAICQPIESAQNSGNFGTDARQRRICLNWLQSTHMTWAFGLFGYMCSSLNGCNYYKRVTFF
jgi:hypothetical protein